jgi:hypothetical protein
VGYRRPVKVADTRRRPILAAIEAGADVETLLMGAVDAARGCVSDAAKGLGIGQGALHIWLNKLGLKPRIRERWPRHASARQAPPIDTCGPSPVTPWPVSGGVYFVACGQVIKIGVAVNVRKRLIGVQAACPFRLSLLAVAPGGVREEAAYHERFAAHRRHFEWFTASPEILAEVERLRGAP